MSRSTWSTSVSTTGPVGDQQHGAPGRGGQQVRGERLGGRLVEVLGGLVEDHHGEAGQQHPRQREPLALPAGQPGAVLTDLGVEPAGQAGDPVVKPGPAQASYPASAVWLPFRRC